MSALSSRRRSTPTPGSAAAEFEFCLRCGARLVSWGSRIEGLGLHCSEQLTLDECSRLRRVALGQLEDLTFLETQITCKRGVFNAR